MTMPSESTLEDVQQQIEFQLYAAMAATSALLPRMRQEGSGTLIYTTGAGSVDPVPQIGNVNAAAAALRNWTVNLHKGLSGTEIYAPYMAINVSIDVPALPGFPTAPQTTSPTPTGNCTPSGWKPSMSSTCDVAAVRQQHLI